MGANIDAGEEGIVEAHELKHTVVNFGDTLDGEITTADTRLVCDDDELVAGDGKPLETFNYARNDFNLIGAGEIVAFNDKGAVAVQENGFVKIHQRNLSLIRVILEHDVVLFWVSSQ
jgi:hypothetical protein